MSAVEHWLVLGASSAIARAFVRQIASRGASITLSGRDLEDLQASAADALQRGACRVHAVECDVTDAVSRDALVAQVRATAGVLSVLVAVGDMPEQARLDQDPTLLQRMIAANYGGPVAVLQGLAPLFEGQRGGRVVVIGSVAGDRGRRKNYLYGSAKAALATYTEGLRARLHAFGTSVTLVKPGFVDTAMTWGLPGLFLVASPAACAQSILSAADRGRATVYHPAFWRLIMLVIRLLPAAVMKRMNF